MQVSALALAQSGPFLAIEVNGEYAGSTTALGPMYSVLARDEALWRNVRAASCAAPKTETDCDAVKVYVATYPGGLHSDDATRLIAGSEEAIKALRRRRAVDAAVKRQLEDTSGIAISNIRVRVTSFPKGMVADASQRYIAVKVDLTVRRKQPGGTHVLAIMKCQVGEKRMVDDSVALTSVSTLDIGDTKEFEFTPFIGAPLSREPSMCDLLFGTLPTLGALDDFTPAARVCLSMSRMRSGSCSWPTD